MKTRIPGSPPVIPPPPADTGYSYGSPPIRPRIGPWENRLVILGVIWFFPFLLTIPGWMALKRYRRWKAGEVKRPNAIIVWGILWTAFLILGIVMEVTGLADGSTPPVPVVQPGQNAGDPSAKSVGPSVGQCGRKVGDQLRWTPGAKCVPTDEIIVIAVQALPHTPRHGPVRTAAVKLAAAKCPTATRFYSAYVANLACWGRR